MSISAISANSFGSYQTVMDKVQDLALQLRQKTGAPLTTCKRALVLSGNNVPSALQLLSRATPQELLSGQFKPNGARAQ